MKKILGFVLLFATPLSGIAQDWHIGGIAGISNYSGDLTEKRVELRYSRPMVGIMLKKDINRYLTVRGAFSYGVITAADSTNKDSALIARNLSFRSRIWEGQIGAEFNILDIDVKGFTPYVFASVALFNFYPTAKDTAGNTIPLRRLSTEGQGLPQYPEKGNQYNLTQISIPFGIGFKYIFTDRLTLGFEIGLRKTFTDYLDDVSGTYVDMNTLLAERGAKAVEMAYRGNQRSGKAGQGTYPPDGAQRGNPGKKDWYAFSGLTVMYRFGNGANGGRKSTNFSRCFRM